MKLAGFIREKESRQLAIVGIKAREPLQNL